MLDLQHVISGRRNISYGRILRTLAWTMVLCLWSLPAWAEFGSTTPKNGKVTTWIQGKADLVQCLAIQSDGKVVAAGSSVNPSTSAPSFAIARYTSQGDLDTGFDNAGIPAGTIISPIGSQAYANAIAVQSDGKILVSGYAIVSGTYYFAMERFLGSNGALDNGFGSGGLVTTNVGQYCAATAMALQSDNKIILAGRVNSSGYHVVMARYNTDGSLDTTFGTGPGYTVAPQVTNTSYNTGLGVFINSNQKIVLVGYGSGSGGTGPILFCYSSDGRTLDTTFAGGKGDTLDASGEITSPLAAALQSDDKIVVCGYNSTSHFALARYQSNGLVDTTFGSGGYVDTPLVGSSQSWPNAVTVTAGNKIVAAGYYFNTTAAARDFAVARYLSTGALDNSFNGTGYVTTNFNGYANYNDSANAVAWQSDGKILAGGYTTNNSNNRQFALARYNADGSLDEAPTPTPTPTSSHTPTPTHTPTISPTMTHTPTISPTSTISPTFTDTPTITPTSTFTRTITMTSTRTRTPTRTTTLTITPYRIAEGEVISYPSPAMGKHVWFYYQAEPGEHDRIEIFNLLGEKCVELPEQTTAGGYQRMVWNIANVAPGIYIYRLIRVRTNGTTVSGWHKFIVVKQ